jgi:hyaluronoglucosaminidase
VLRILTAASLLALFASSAPSAAATEFAYRGVIEGFYGPPWPSAARLEFLQWMLDHGMNLYIHAPKNDPYQRLSWRSAYPQAEIDQFAAEIALAGTRLAWVPSISPGQPLVEAADPHDADICFSCPADFAALVAKLDQFWDVGARTLMVSFDDVIKASTHPEDALAYGTGDYAYGVMNGDLLNRLFDHYRARAAADGSQFRLITVPADYFGVSTTPYLEGLRATLTTDPAMIVMWTGVLVVSPTISCTEANGFAAAIGRKPLLWDNFPVNDYAMPAKLMVGPYAGRAADLPDCLAGIASNPSNQVMANEIPLFTVADYLTDPANYDRESSWETALTEFSAHRALPDTPNLRELLGLMIENVRSTALDRTEAVRFSALRDAFLAALDTPDWPSAHDALAAELSAAAAAPDAIRAGFHPQLVRDLECAFAFQSSSDDCAGSWLARLAFAANNGLETTALVARTRPDVSGQLQSGALTGVAQRPADPDEAQANQQALAGMRNRDDGNPPNVYGDRVFFPLGPPFVEENRMDDYFDSALARAAAYTPTAALASSSISVTVNGAPVAVAPDGSFAAAVAGDVAEVVVTDGAGVHTRRFLPEPDGALALAAGAALLLGLPTNRARRAPRTRASSGSRA